MDTTPYSIGLETAILARTTANASERASLTSVARVVRERHYANSIRRVTPKPPPNFRRRAARFAPQARRRRPGHEPVGDWFWFRLRSQRSSGGLTPLDASAMSLFVFAGASQFAAVGYIAAASAGSAIVVLTALINARHFLYSAAIAPYFARRPAPERAVMAHVLTDEAFALSIAHFNRIGRGDRRGYWIAAC